LAKSDQETGAELFVLDDGWFGERNSSEAGILDLGGTMKGDSDLYRDHPEWAVEQEAF